MSITIISYSRRHQDCGSFFLANRAALNLLFEATAQTILTLCQQYGFTPGIVSVLHTFGGNLNFHPHIHILLTEGGITDDHKWKRCHFFPEKPLKAKFKYFLLKYLRSWAKKKLLIFPDYVRNSWRKNFNTLDFFSVSRMLYQIVWYAWIGEKLDNADYTARYIGRYAQRPCLSETKITAYSFEKQTVSFIFKDKITKTLKLVNLSVDDFIGQLIRHIPEKHFRMVRYYGFYSNRVRTELLPIIKSALGIAKESFAFKPVKWRERIFNNFGYDPLLCPDCGELMVLRQIFIPAKHGPPKVIDIF
jgi:hypothetical protein